MVDVRAVVKEVRDTLVTGLGAHLQALYLFGSAARGQYVPGRSDIDLLLVVDPVTPLLAVRELYRSLWERHAAALGHGPLVATPQDLALHLILFPSDSGAALPAASARPRPGCCHGGGARHHPRDSPNPPCTGPGAG
jgi:predicted nucleotidyltransferase